MFFLLSKFFSNFIYLSVIMAQTKRTNATCKIKDFWVIPAGDVNPLQADFGFRGSYVHLGSPVFDLFQTKKRSLASSGAFFADIAPFFL